MRIEGAHFAEREASAELIREMMADDAKRGPYMLLMQDGDEEAFVQIAFDDHPDGIDLEYREGAGTPIFHCTRPVSRAEAERALLEYFAGWKTWKNRFPWEKAKGAAAAVKAGKKWGVGEVILDFVWIAVGVALAGKWVWTIVRDEEEARVVPAVVSLVVFAVALGRAVVQARRGGKGRGVVGAGGGRG